MVQRVAFSQKLRLFALEACLNSIKYGADIFIRSTEEKIVHLCSQCDFELLVSEDTRLIQPLLEADAYEPWVQSLLPVLRC